MRAEEEEWASEYLLMAAASVSGWEIFCGTLYAILSNAWTLLFVVSVSLTSKNVLWIL